MGHMLSGNVKAFYHTTQITFSVYFRCFEELFALTTASGDDNCVSFTQTSQ